MSRLVIPTNSEAQNVVEGLYKDLERRIIASRSLSCRPDRCIFKNVPCTDLRQMRSLPNRSRAALQSSGRHPKRKRNHEAFNHAGGNSPCHRKHG